MEEKEETDTKSKQGFLIEQKEEPPLMWRFFFLSRHG
jgi:hypothetical protein